MALLLALNNVAAFGLGLVLGLMVTHCTDAAPTLRRVSLVLTLNWLLALGAVAVFHDKEPWAAFFLIDTVAAVLVLRHPRGAIQQVIGSFYAVQIVAHVTYMLVVHHYPGDIAPAKRYYHLMLDTGGGLQIATLLAGTIYGACKRIAYRARRSGGSFRAAGAVRPFDAHGGGA